MFLVFQNAIHILTGEYHLDAHFTKNANPHIDTFHRLGSALRDGFTISHYTSCNKPAGAALQALTKSEKREMGKVQVTS